ncbi:MAG TPA: nitroreductase/quinone reductase family protein [Methanothrix sp.]|nr:nitroreductase/quinone reductase family protein [Methanothrix sp.]
MDQRSLLRAVFRIVNRFIVVPGFKMGLGRFISNPLTGNIMVLGIRGRKTGKIRYAPVSFAWQDEKVYCYQGKETRGQWYLNILAHPDVDVLLPRERFTGRAEQLPEGPERLKALRMLLQGSGLSRSMYGFNPADASDQELEEKTRGIPVISISLNQG